MKLYFVEINGSRAAVKKALESGKLVAQVTSNGRGGGIGAGQLVGISTDPLRALDKALLVDNSELGRRHCFGAGHGSMAVTPLETAEAVAAAANRLRQPRRRR
jgi:hypothetical protein